MTERPANRIARGIAASVFALFASFAVPAAAVTIDTVPVGHAGNAPHPFSLRGSVGYDYRIGTTEVTNAQYAEFLNFKAASDPLGLYNASMGSDVRGGITRSGDSGSFTYATKTNMDNKPVNFVSWYDAIRFANWLHNGQGSGDTETGAYTLLGGTATPSNGGLITRNAAATWFLPSDDEWYKAAYHWPYFYEGDWYDQWLLYPFATDGFSDPTIATADSVGDISNPGPNVANYYLGANWNAVTGNVTTVGSAGPLSKSHYGTSDQGGNVWEWNETSYGGMGRLLRGGSFQDTAFAMSASLSYGYSSANEYVDLGFRVAHIPEPSTAVLAMLGIGLTWMVRKRLKYFR